MPLLGGKAVPDVDGAGDCLTDLAGVVQHPGHHVLSNAHSSQLRCNCSSQIMWRCRAVSQPEVVQCLMHGMSDTMGRQMLLAHYQSRSRPARKEERRFSR